MKFRNELVNKEDRYAIGVEVDSGRYFLSIPVRNQMVEYSEFYEIDESEFLEFKENILLALPLVDKCRKHENDDNLIIPPSHNRGEAF
ncbi:hypothetical protein [Dickeya zeae]|uniref:hypothetical protein n=1 Tax=Dickeya zeae TaxID=204042 RepID=UPI000C9BB400|nr:hypothetical protein [Dickeya zeae]AUQ25665.1 hypothetical protein C1O30_11545 [Dickeya zeae]UJR58740.1 hypothetical protein HJ580_11445 [Dickeya zeae]